jgi:hypothetical protein
MIRPERGRVFSTIPTEQAARECDELANALQAILLGIGIVRPQLERLGLAGEADCLDEAGRRAAAALTRLRTLIRYGSVGPGEAAGA